MKTISSNLFTQFCVSEHLKLSKNMPDIEQIISCVIDPQILSIKTIHTMKGLSYEGQCLTGKKVVIEFKLIQKILYVAEFDTQSVHVIENEFYQSAYIVIPCELEGTNPDELIKKNFLKPKIILEEINCHSFNKRTIIKNIFIRIELLLIPTFELCYSSENTCGCSDIFMMYNQGTNNIRISNCDSTKNVKPKWSPNGYEIAYLANVKGCWLLYIYSLKNNTVLQALASDIFPSITGFCWTADGRNICATVYDGQTKELFMIFLHQKKCKQLTYGGKTYSSYSPKCSLDGEKIAFLRSYSDKADLWLMNVDGTDCKKITNNCKVSSFDWSADSVILAFINYINSTQNYISIINTKNNDLYTIKCSPNITNKRKVRYSSDGQYLAFIGTYMAADNIYLYCIQDKSLTNITCFTCNEQISDFVWKIDDCIIYFSMKEQVNFNIYSIHVDTLCKSQLTFTNAKKIELDYRPRIS